MFLLDLNSSFSDRWVLIRLRYKIALPNFRVNRRGLKKISLRKSWGFVRLFWCGSYVVEMFLKSSIVVVLHAPACNSITFLPSPDVMLRQFMCWTDFVTW